MVSFSSSGFLIQLLSLSRELLLAAERTPGKGKLGNLYPQHNTVSTIKHVIVPLFFYDRWDGYKSKVCWSLFTNVPMSTCTLILNDNLLYDWWYLTKVGFSHQIFSENTYYSTYMWNICSFFKPVRRKITHIQMLGVYSTLPHGGAVDRDVSWCCKFFHSNVDWCHLYTSLVKSNELHFNYRLTGRAVNWFVLNCTDGTHPSWMTFFWTHLCQQNTGAAGAPSNGSAEPLWLWPLWMSDCCRVTILTFYFISV